MPSTRPRQTGRGDPSRHHDGPADELRDRRVGTCLRHDSRRRALPHRSDLSHIRPGVRRPHAYDRSRGGTAAPLVRARTGATCLASNHGPIRDPRQRDHAATDPGRSRRPALPRMARAVADGGSTRRGRGGRGDSRLAGARVQPASRRAPPRGAGDRARRLAGRPDAASRRRAVHRSSDPELRLRRGRAAPRCQRRSRRAPDRARASAARRRRH